MDVMLRHHRACADLKDSEPYGEPIGALAFVATAVCFVFPSEPSFAHAIYLTG